ncbi:MAG: hypothetical protein U0746_21045 [Gemmataceae bacterium]
MSRPYSTLVVAILGVLVGESVAATPREAVLRVVPENAGFCLLVTDLRGRLDEFRRSPFVERLLASPIGQALRADPELQKLAKFDEQLRAALDTSTAQLRDDIFGDAVLLTFTPGPPDKPELDSGLFALYARDPALLARLVERLNVTQQQSGEIIDIQQREHGGVRYWQRRKKAEDIEFVAVRGSLFLLADKEAAIHAAIDRGTSSGSSAVGRRIGELGLVASPIVWWLNPRAFDPALRHKLATTSGTDATFLRTFVRYWESLDDVALHLRIDNDAIVELSIRARTNAMPANARRLLTDAGTPSALLSAFPADALFIAGGRLTLDAMAQVGGEFLSADARREAVAGLQRSVGAVLGNDALTAFVQAAGPDWGVCVRPPDGKGGIPSLLAALRLRPAGDPPVEQRAIEGLDFVARLIAFAVNSQHGAQWRVRSERQGAIDVRFIDPDAGLPAGLRPAFAWKDRFLVVGSSPEAIRQFTPPTAEPQTTTGNVLLARLSARAWASYLRRYRDEVATFLADANKQPRSEVQQRLDGLIAVTDLFDSVELSQATTAGGAKLTLRLKPANPFASDEATKKPH